MTGRLEVITGPMFSGKTEELIRRLRREQIGQKNVILFKPAIDTRYGEDVKTHDGISFPATVCEDSLFSREGKFKDVIGIDEVQFFDPKEALADILWLTENDYKVIVSGLDMTYRQEPFGIVPELMAYADSVTKLNAVCHKCGNDAIYTQRLVNGKPASFKGDTIVVGGLDTYEARCRGCFERA